MIENLNFLTEKQELTMTAYRKKVTLIKDFNPDHNGECLNCNCCLSDCECLYLVSDYFLEVGDDILYNHKLYKSQKVFDEHVVLNEDLMVNIEDVHKVIITPPYKN